MAKTLKQPSLKVNASVICKNCNNEVAGNFCGSCGQSAKTDRIDMHVVLHDLQHGLLHFDKGIFYTTKQLLTKPGHTIREYLDGKRVRHLQPFSFVIVLATFYGLLYHYLVFKQPNSWLPGPNDDITSASAKIVTWITEHFAFNILIFILTTTVVSYVIFKKQKYNLAEHFTLNTFSLGLFTVVSLFLFPIAYVFDGAATLQYGIIQQAILLVIMCWSSAQFFKNSPQSKIIGLTIVAFFVVSMINLAIGFFAVWVLSHLNVGGH
jgi:hypothetical protein